MQGRCFATQGRSEASQGDHRKYLKTAVCNHTSRCFISFILARSALARSVLARSALARSTLARSALARSALVRSTLAHSALAQLRCALYSKQYLLNQSKYCFEFPKSSTIRAQPITIQSRASPATTHGIFRTDSIASARP